MPSELNAVRVYMSDDENNLIKKQAAEKELTVSNFVRKKLGLKEIERGKPKKETKIKK